MAQKRDLERILDVVTVGGEAAGVARFRTAAVACHEEHRPWTESAGIQGFGIAERVTEGKKLDELTIKVYVDRKLPRAKVESPVPERISLPGTDLEVETDGEEIGRVGLEILTGRYRPAMPGASVSHPAVTAGTFGCLVRKRGIEDRLYILSNSHVLADQGIAEVDDPILQNARDDGGREPDDVIARLKEWVPFEFTGEGYPNLVDAAIAEVDPADVTAAVHGLGVPTAVSTAVRRGMMVHKCGRTTGLTYGEVRDTNYRLPMWYKRRNAQGHVSLTRAGLRDQVLCSRFTDGGDSGSAVFSSSGKLVGLHFAGSRSSSIFNRIGHVIDALDLEIVTGAAGGET